MFRSGTIQICYKPICRSECWQTEFLQGWKLRDGTAPENIANPRLWRVANVDPGSGGVYPLLLPTQGQTPDSLVPHTPPSPAPPPPRRSRISCPTEAGLGEGGGGLAFPGRRVTGSAVLGQSADRQAPEAISGGAQLSAQFPFFHHRKQGTGNLQTSQTPSLRRGSRDQERQGSCVRNGVGADATPTPAPSIQPYSLTVLGNIGEGQFHTQENDPALKVGQAKCITFSSP